MKVNNMDMGSFTIQYIDRCIFIIIGYLIGFWYCNHEHKKKLKKELENKNKEDVKPHAPIT